MNRAERIYRLHTLLKSRYPVKLQDLITRLETSRATINRDLAYMRDFMGAPIHYDRHANGHHYDPTSPEFELPGLWFNNSELYALLATEQLLESVQPGLLSPYIGPLKNRIRKLLAESGHQSKTIISHIQLQPVAMRPVDDELFGQVASAVLNAQIINIEYDGRERGEKTTRQIHPYRLLHYRDNWYLIAWCQQAENYRTFSLDRIRKAELTGGHLKLIEEKELRRYISASFGIFTGEAKHWAVLQFSAQRARWVADERWHPDQIGQWKGDNYELQIPYSDERELLMEILKYGADVKVIAPEELRQKVQQSLQTALDNYP